ncbi:MAG: hypothetical protein HYX39_05660 [Bacteroidetes bacterium]|nr:hypothetical protein [Bacteroidota bacterium]
MKVYFIIFLFFSITLSAQDKIFLKEGKVKKGVVISQGIDFILFKTSDTAATIYKIPKSNVMMIEKYDGKVFTYGTKISKTDSSFLKKVFKKNSFGLQPFGFFTGRLAVSYERLNKEGAIGYCFPVALTFDPVGVIYPPRANRFGTITHKAGYNFIGGIDVNFYIGKRETWKFFVGPRIRYGVNMFLINLEAYSIQTQFGWRIGKPNKLFTQHISVGLGIARILSSQAGNRINPKQSYGWGSINYRIGVNW